MNSKKEFRYSWNDYLLKEAFGSPTMRRFAGHAEIGTATEPEPEPDPGTTPVPPKEQNNALILRAKGELEKASGPDAVTTALQRIKAALEKIKGLNPLLVLATMGKDKAKDLGTGLAEFMLEKNAAAVKTIFETMGVRTQAAAVMDRAVNWQGRNEKEFFAYDFATIGESLVSEEATDTPQGSQQQLQFLGYLEQRIDMLFGKRFVSQDWQRFVVAQAIVVYWETMMASNPRRLEEAQLPAVKVIGEHTIKYLQGLVSTFNVDAEKKKADQQIASITDPKKDQKQIAAPKEKPKAQGGTVPRDFEWPQMKKGGMINESVYREERQKQNNRWKYLAGIK